MNAVLIQWTFKKRLLYIYSPTLLAISIFLGLDLGNRLTILDLIGLYLECFVFSFAVCLLTYELAFHTFDFLRWFAKGMKKK